jgi:transglutaminase-like putative cysteine protease
MVMSGRGKLALSALLATLLAACALLPLVDSYVWLFEAAVPAALVSAVGALTRRVPLARTLTVLIQALLVLLLLTVVFARDAAPLGVLPTPEVFERFSLLLSSGSEDVTRYSIPAPPTEGIKLMLIGGVLIIGLAVDAIAVTFRNAAPAGLPLLALYSVAAGISGGTGSTASWLWFLLAAVGYLVLLLAEGGDRLAQWGRVFGGGPQRPGRPPGAPPRAASAPARTGRRIGVVALGIALVVPLALPALGGGLLAGIGGGNGTGIGGGGTISAVNPLVSLQDDLNQNDDREALRYRTNAPDGQGMYLRIMSLDQFDGTTWRFSQRKVEDVPDSLPTPQGLAPGVSTTQISTSVTAAPWYRQNYLPMPYPATSVSVKGRWRYEPEGRTLVGDRGQSTRDASYRVNSLEVHPTRQQLASAGAPPASLEREYTEVPPSLPAVVKRTAQQITAGSANDYEKAVALQDWFSSDGGFTYDTHVNSGTGPDAITRFLKDKRGFCIHFSFTMAAMARTLGIPARVAVGFAPGTPEGDGTVDVGLRDAHAWPELYFQGVGWTRFEPTPSRGSLPDYTLPVSPSDPDSGTSTQPDSTESAAPSTAPSTSSSCAPQDQRLGACDQSALQAPAPPSGPGAQGGTWALIGAGIALLVLIPLLPLAYRSRARSRRLGTGAHLGADPSATVLAAWRELTDTAWDHGIPPDEAQTPRRAAERIVRLGGLDETATAAAHRLADAVEQVLYAPDPVPRASLADDVRRVRASLRASAGRAARLRALLLPRSAVRVVWALSERREALASRWTPQRLLPAAWRRP